MMTRSALFASLVAGVALMSAPDPAAAEPKHCPPGHAMQDRCDLGDGAFRFRGGDLDFRDRDRDRDFDFRDRLDFEDELDDAYEEGFRDGRRDLDFRIGDRLDRDRYRVLDRDLFYDQYGYPLDDRYYYADVDGRRLLIEQATGAIVNMLMR